MKDHIPDVLPERTIREAHVHARRGTRVGRPDEGAELEQGLTDWYAAGGPDEPMRRTPARRQRRLALLR